MPGQGRTDYYWKRYHELRESGYNKEVSARTATLIEDRHNAKVERRKKAKKK